MKRRFKTVNSVALSIALKRYVESFVDYPHSQFMDDLLKISEMCENAYSVEIVVNPSCFDDKEFNYDENL